MNKCQLCQQICNNVIKIYSNRIKNLAEIILKLKGFKEPLKINNELLICANCKQGLENVASLWEHIPEAKQNISNNATSSLQEIYETCQTTNSQEEVDVYNTNNSPVIKLESKCGKEYDEPKKPIKLKIKKIKDENNSYTLVSSNSTEEYSSKRLRQPPKRYNDFNVDLPSNVTEILINKTKIRESSLNKLSPMATIRSSTNGINLGYLYEIEKNGQTSRMRMVCKLCSSTFDYEKQFKIHIEKHKTNEDLKAIDTRTHNYYLFHCKLCEKTFKEHYAVRRHYKFAHSDNKSFNCKHCEASFKYKFNLDYHMAKHISKTRFECSYCKKSFIMRYELKIHIRTHTKERPYKCEFCPYAFAHSSNLKAHQKLKHPPINSPVKARNQSDIVNIAECHSEYINKGNEVKDVENISLYDKPNNNEENLSSSTVRYKSKEIFLENSKSSSSSQTDNQSEEFFINRSNVIQVEEEKRIVIHPNTNRADNFIYNYRKQLTSCASLYPFKIENTALRIIPQSSLLTMKKWPKSYQRAITENPKIKDAENRNTFLENETPNQLNENSLICINNLGTNKSSSVRYVLSSERNAIDMEQSNILDGKQRNIDDECKQAISHPQNKVATNAIEISFDSKLSMKTCNILCAKNSSESVNETQEIKDSLYTKINSDSDFANKSLLNKEISSFACSNIKYNSPNSNKAFLKSGESCSHLKDSQKLETSDKTNNIAKCSNFIPAVIDPNFSGDIKITKVSTKTKVESNPMQLLNNSKRNMTAEIKIDDLSKPYMSHINPKAKSQKVNEIKVSARPVKIIKLNHLKTCNSLLKTPSEKHQVTKNCNLKQISANKNGLNSNFSLINPAFNGAENQIIEAAKSTTAAKNSLLKPKVTAQQKYNSSSNILSTNSFTENLPNKPLITKVEILPSLISSSPLGSQALLPSPIAAQTHIQPPKEYKHQCPHCWKYFKQKSPLTKHLRTHTGEKPYKCNLCPKSYADASNYKKHRILHKNAAESLNISYSTTAHPMQNSPAYSTVSDPDPDGIEVMQTINKFPASSPSDENDNIYEDDDDNDSLPSSTMESYMWQDALDHALSNDEIRENIIRNLTSLSNAIMPNNVVQQKNNEYRNLSCEDPD